MLTLGSAGGYIPETIIVLVSLVICLYLRRGRSSLPPYPSRPLPLVGHMLALNRDPRAKLRMWRKNVGDIFSLSMAGSPVVVINGYQLIQEALVQKAEIFMGRPHLFFDQATGYAGRGVAFSSGHEWKEQRAATISILRTLGLGKNLLAEKIKEEVSTYLEYLSKLNGKPIDIQRQTTVSITNIICSILIRQRFDYDDRDFQKMITNLQHVLCDQQSGSLLNFMPWLQYLPGDFFHAKTIIASFKTVVDFLKHSIEDIKTTKSSEANDETDFVREYIKETTKKKASNNPTTMDSDSLIKIVLELLTAGTDTTSNTIDWFILFMIAYPDVQEKVHQDIVSAVGRSHPPGLEDKTKLHYLNATIMEVQRLVSVAPLGLGHTCHQEVTIGGYQLPAGTFVLTSLDSVHHDPDVWGEDVMSFKPDRFLKDGRVQPRKELIPFSVGPRMCLGEGLAKMELFLFLSQMFQRFKFLAPDNECPDPNNYQFGFVVAPQRFRVVVEERTE